MPNLADYQPEKRFYGLFVGASGAGKTSAMLSFPKPIYAFDIDGRIVGGLGHPENAKMSREEKALIEYDQYPMTPEGLERVDKKLEEFKKQDWKLKYKTILFGSLTSFDRQVLAYAFSKISDPAKKFGIYATEGFDHYNVEKKGIETLLTEDLKCLPCNVIVETHWTTAYESAKPGLPATIPVGKKIALRDKLAETVPVWFNDIFFFSHGVERTLNEEKRIMEDKVRRKVVFRNELARTTYTELPDSMDWTDKNFYDILLNSLSKEHQETVVK